MNDGEMTWRNNVQHSSTNHTAYATIFHNCCCLAPDNKRNSLSHKIKLNIWTILSNTESYNKAIKRNDVPHLLYMTIIRQLTIKGSDACLPASASLLAELYPVMHIFKMMQHSIYAENCYNCHASNMSMACCISTLNGKYNRKSEQRAQVRLLLKPSNCCLAAVQKLSVPSNQSNVCHVFLFSPGKWVMQRALRQQLLIWFCTTWSNLNLLKDDYSRPSCTTNDVSVVFARGSQEKKKDIPATETRTLCTEKSALLGTIMLQTMEQIFSLSNLLSF
jgi:hypothetical protein